MKFSKNNLGDRIRSLRESKGLSQQELASMIPVSQAVLHRLETGQAKTSGKLVEIATALGVTAEYIQTGKGFINDSPSSSKIPILSWGEIKKWVLLEEKYPLLKEESREFISSPKQDINSKSAYALKIMGNSMQGESHESFNIGDYIIVDPDKQEKSGDFIIYGSPDEKTPLVRKLIIENKNYLVPINNFYPLEVINDTSHSCGVVVSKVSIF